MSDRMTELERIAAARMLAGQPCAVVAFTAPEVAHGLLVDFDRDGDVVDSWRVPLGDADGDSEAA